MEYRKNGFEAKKAVGEVNMEDYQEHAEDGPLKGNKI
jgi:hypothetical protein